jgi:hypothetical protein
MNFDAWEVFYNMNLKDLRVGTWIFNNDKEGRLFFKPDHVVAKAVYGLSIYIPNDVDEKASILANDTVIKEGDIVVIGSIEKIYADFFRGGVLHLSGFRPVGKEDEAYLMQKMSRSTVQDS